MNRNSTKKAVCAGLAVLLLAAGILTGCGRAESSDAYKTGTAPVAAPAPSPENSYTAGTAYKEAGTYDYDAAEEAVAGGSDSGISDLSGAGSGALRAPGNAADKLIYSGSIRLQTLEYEKTMKSIHDRIADVGGFVQYEDESDGNDTWYYSTPSVSRRYAQIEARIPAEQFETFMDGLKDDGQVMNRHVNVDNISQTYADTEASAEAYRIEQERLLDMMDKAETIEDMIAVEARLSEVEAELNRYKTSLASMDRDVEYSTVSISVNEVREYTEEPDDSTFLSRLKETVKSSWSGFLWFMEGLLHVVIRLLPFIIVIVVIFLIVHGIAKKTEPGRLARRQKQAQQKMQKAMERQQRYMQKHPGMPAPPQMPQTPPQQDPALPPQTQEPQQTSVPQSQQPASQRNGETQDTNVDRDI